jgi:putative DNA primase/helicase
MTAITKMAEEYLKRGWVTVPVHPESKRPIPTAWQNRTLEDVHPENDFSTDENIGIVLGKPSNDLVDIDLDCDEAIRVASVFLPKTGAVFGRSGSLKSHWLYTVPDCGGRVEYSGPGNEGMLAEYRADGCQTVAPPSTHISGESIEFHSDDEPGRVERDELLNCITRLASAALLAIHWNSGTRHKAAMALSGGLLKSGWSLDDTEYFIKAVCFAANDDEVDDRLRAVSDTEDKLASGENITGWPTLCDLMGEQVVETVAKWLGIETEPAPGGIGHNHPPANDNEQSRSDLGNADRFVSQHRQNVRWCEETGRWFVWCGTHWVEQRRGAVDLLAQETARSILTEADQIQDSTDRDLLKSWAKSSGNSSRLKGMLETSKPRLPVLLEKMDANPWLLNCQNGTVDLCTGDLKPHSRADMITMVAAAPYDPDAKCPVFDGFLGRIADGNAELVAFIKRALGYSLTGKTDEQCLFIAYGEGANGKSTLLNCVRELLGDYALNTPTSTLMAKKGDPGPGNDIARLRGKRLITASEGESTQNLAESVVKQITGGDILTVRFLYGEYHQLTIIGKVFFGTNHKPKIAGMDEAIWRRIHLIPFDVTILKEERDAMLPEKLKGEFPGILAWAVRGCRDWQNGGLQPPEIVQDATDGYRTEMDEVAEFKDEMLTASPGQYVTKADMYTAFQDWCQSAGANGLKKTDFGKRLKALGLEEGKSSSKGGRHWKDVILPGNTHSSLV